MTTLQSEPPGAHLGDLPTLVNDLTALGNYLLEEGYSFTTVTPATHARVLVHAGNRRGTTLRDIFGWNLPFDARSLPNALIARLRGGGLVQVDDDGLMRSTIRFATVHGRIYVHDSFPTLAADAVFFGPDTYRFITAVLARLNPCDLLVDVCCGSGAGGLEAGTGLANRVILADINQKALAFATVNCLVGNHHTAVLQHADLLNGLDERPDAIIANPPYLADPLGRAYRDGSGVLGTGLALRILRDSLKLLAPGGQLLLYTGSPVIDGIDRFAAEALPMARAKSAKVHYEEIDPDVFGEELENPAYAEVERIAAVVLTLTMPSS